MKKILNVVGVLSLGASILSFVLLLDHALRFGWNGPAVAILRTYESLKEIAFGFIDPLVSPLVSFIAGLTGWPLNLQPHWSDVFILTALYLGARATAYWKAGLKGRAVFRIVWGGVVGLLSGIIAGSIMLSDFTSNLIMACIPIAGILIFDIIDSSYSATFHRKGGLSWTQDFLRYANFGLPPAVLGFAMVGLAALTFDRFLQSKSDYSGLLILATVTVALAIYWIIRGWFYSANKEPNRQWQSFLRSSNTAIGAQMLIVIIGAFLFILGGAGFNLPSK